MANVTIDVDDVFIVVWVAWGAGLLALLTALMLARTVLNNPTGTDKMRQIALNIQHGAEAYLQAEYSRLAIFVVIAAVVVALINMDAGPWQTAICFLVGAALSALTGYIGMSIAVRANVRTAAAAMNPTSGMSDALRVAFNSGSVMGLSVVGFGLMGLTTMWLIFTKLDTTNLADAGLYELLAGFAFGASSIALFARVGGGIYTKAADVGSDLVGKVEAGIPEDDPRNPGVIADNVGDNVGDVAGMGADLYESYCGSIIAASTLGDALRGSAGGVAVEDFQAVALPFIVAAIGIVASIIGGLTVRTVEGASQSSLLWSMRKGVMISSSLLIIGVAVVNHVLYDIDAAYTGCIYIGLVAGILIGNFTEYATSFAYAPTQGIARAGVTGPATVIIQGLGVGQLSTFPPVVVICVTIVLCLNLAGVYGVSIAAVGMLSTLGVTLSTDAYGPVADNAGGIAEMAELPEEVRERTDALDALGNTTAATGKGFAIGSAVLTALALMSAFTKRVGLESVDLVSEARNNSAMVIPGLLFGTMLPFVFSALTMLAVGKSAQAIIVEVRRQFREIPGLLEGREGVDADHAKCVAISTKAALREMVMPGFVAVVTPFIIGLGFGAQALAGVLIGSISSGFLLAIMMANAGGAWDNAKKWVEAGDSGLGGKGTNVHKAVVTGDTVGDPFKDTSGPSLNILLKLLSIVSLVVAPLFRAETQEEYWWVAIIIFVVALLFVIGWSAYLRRSEITFDVPAEDIESSTTGEGVPLTSMSRGGDRRRRRRPRHPPRARRCDGSPSCRGSEATQRHGGSWWHLSRAHGHCVLGHHGWPRLHASRQDSSLVEHCVRR
jgi:H(+)-translocating pyrophosphatase